MNAAGTQRVLLLGAGGFLGTQIARVLQRRPAVELICAPRSCELDLVRASPAQWDALLAHACPDVIVNAAGRTDGTPTELHAANVTLVARWLDAVGRSGHSPWLVHLGSAAEYGATAPGQPVQESARARPESEYGRSKFRASVLLGHATRRGPLQGVVLRIFNPVGAGQKAGTLPGRAAAMFAQAQQHQQRDVTFGPLTTGRDFVDVRDVARAVACVAGLRGTPAVLNVASGQTHSARALVSMLARIAAFQGEIHETEAGSARSAAVSWQQADVSRLRALGWVPTFTLADALEDLWAGLGGSPTPLSSPPSWSPYEPSPLHRTAAPGPAAHGPAADRLFPGPPTAGHR
jgi:NDP-hexose 4-ketoreductase